MLDLRFIRQNPSQAAHELSKRGISVDFQELQQIANKQLNLENQISELQREGNQIGKEVGEKIGTGINPKSLEISKLRERGNKTKKKIA